MLARLVLSSPQYVPDHSLSLWNHCFSHLANFYSLFKLACGWVPGSLQSPWEHKHLAEPQGSPSQPFSTFPHSPAEPHTLHHPACGPLWIAFPRYLPALHQGPREQDLAFSLMWPQCSPVPGNVYTVGVCGGHEDIWKSHPELGREIRVKAKEYPVRMWEGQSEDGESQW